MTMINDIISDIQSSTAPQIVLRWTFYELDFWGTVNAAD